MPIGEDSLVAEERVIGGEQDALGKPPREAAAGGAASGCDGNAAQNSARLLT